MAVHPILKDWNLDPEEVSAKEYNRAVILRNKAVVATLPQLSSEQLRDLYFSLECSNSIRVRIVAQAHAPYEVVRHGLFCDEPLIAKVSCVNYRLFDEDLEEASRTHRWNDVRKEIARVLARRREIGYVGSDDLSVDRIVV